MPILIAPIMAFQCLTHPEGEMAIAQPVADCGEGMLLMTICTPSLEAVATTGDQAPQWFQLSVAVMWRSHHFSGFGTTKLPIIVRLFDFMLKFINLGKKILIDLKKKIGLNHREKLKNSSTCDQNHLNR